MSNASGTEAGNMQERGLWSWMEQRAWREERVGTVVRALEAVLTTLGVQGGGGWRGEALRGAAEQAGSRDPSQGADGWILGRVMMDRCVQSRRHVGDRMNRPGCLLEYV